MDDFTQTLKARIETALGKAPPWGDNPNPLVVIGLAAALLDLRLSEDQMYDAVRAYVRKLASLVHPDRQLDSSSIAEDRQRQIFDALNILDDRENFRLALNEFRNLKSEERQEIVTLRHALQNARESLESYRAKELDLERKRRQLSKEQDEFHGIKDGQLKEIQLLDAAREKLSNDLDQAHSSLSRFKRCWYSADRYINWLSSHGDPKSDCAHAFEANWVAAVSLIWRDERLKRTELSRRSQAQRFSKACKLLGIPRDKSRLILKEFAKAEKQFAPDDKKEYRGVSSLQLNLVQTAFGIPKVVFGKENLFRGGRIVGSIPPDRMQIKRSSLGANQDREAMIERLSPFLVPGGLLVNEWIAKSTKVERTGAILTSFSFDTKQYILAVG